jgi:hypothetical protein
MWLVLSQTDDLAALWAARGLEARGLHPLEIVSAEALAYNRRFEHRLTTGKASVSIALADGRMIESASVRGTLNRLQLFPTEHLRGANAVDRRYAEQELFALSLSWLYSLPGRMLNRPTPQSLNGDWRHPSEWARLAAQAGLSTMPYYQSDEHEAPTPAALTSQTTRTLLVVGNRCCDSSIPPTVMAGCAHLAQSSATDLLGIDFNLTRTGDWIFTGATPQPDLRLGGEALLDALAEALQS